jgi:hypothetical protein
MSDDTLLTQLIKRTTNKPDLLSKIPKVVVSLFDGSGTIWQILTKTGLLPEYAFSAEADPYQIALLGARYGYRNPPAWLKEAAPEQNGYENPHGLIHLGSIFPGGKFEHEGNMYTCQEIVDLHTGQKNTPVTMFVGGPVCSSNSGLNRDPDVNDKIADDASSNLAGDFYVDAAKSVRAVNPDVKMVVENIRNHNENANIYNRKVMDAFGATAIDYFNNITDEQGREKADISNKLGLEYRLRQWLNIDTPEESPMSRNRSIWANYRLPSEEYDAIVTDFRTIPKGEKTNFRPKVKPDNPFADGWAPIRGGRLGTLTGHSGIDTDQPATLQEHIATMDSIGTVLAKHDPNGEYILTEDGRPGIIKSRAGKLSKKVKEGTEVINDPKYGEVLVWAKAESKKNLTKIRRPTLPATHLQPGEPYTVRYPSIEEGKKLMWDDETLADVSPEVDQYLMDHAEVYPDFVPTRHHNKKGARHAQGISWHTPTFEKVILGILRSNQKIDPDFGMSEGGYVEGPKKSQPTNRLATKLKELGRF